MQTVINQLQMSENYKEKLRQTCKINKISIHVLKGLTFKKITAFYDRTMKHYNQNPEKARVNWFQNELRLYHWLLIIHSFLFNQLLNQFKEQHWQQIQTFFALKPINILQFESKRLISETSCESRRYWSAQQCELLMEIMKDGSLINRWSQVSMRFYELSGKRWYRSNKQCRQQWFNHLDHSKKHGQWNQEQDVTILQFVLKNGHKWAELRRNLLSHRTEHMIKNRFKSLIIRNQQQPINSHYNERKIIRNILLKSQSSKKTSKNSTFKINTRKTFQTSNQLVESSEKQQFGQPQSPFQNLLQSNNSSSQRQNYQNLPQPSLDPPLPNSHIQPFNNICVQYPPNLFTFYSHFQQTQIPIQQISYTPILPNIYTSYTPFTTNLIYNPTIPHNLF